MKKKTTKRNVKWNLNLVTGDNINLKFGTSSQTREKNLFLLSCVICISCAKEVEQVNFSNCFSNFTQLRLKTLKSSIWSFMKNSRNTFHFHIIVLFNLNVFEIKVPLNLRALRSHIYSISGTMPSDCSSLNAHVWVANFQIKIHTDNS